MLRLFRRSFATSTAIKPTDPPLKDVILSGGRCMKYTIEGGELEDEDRPLVVCVHGAPASVFDFRYSSPALVENGFSVMRLAQPGHGPVELEMVGEKWLGMQGIPPVAWSELNMEVLEALKIVNRKNLVILGHSVGGAVAMGMGMMYDGKSRPRIAAVNSVGARPHNGVRPQQAVYGTSWLAMNGGTLGKKFLRQLAVHGLGYTPRTTEDEAALTMRRAFGIDFEANRKAAETFRKENTPVLCAYSRDDPICELDVTKEWAELANATKLELPDGGHFSLKNHAVEFADSFSQWAKETTKL